MSMKFSWSAAKAAERQVSRRLLLQAGLGVGCWVLAGRGLARDAALRTTQPSPGVHVRRGVDEDATPQNQDAIANSSFIVGRRSVAVIDPGGCLDDGRRLRARIREVTTLPISHVVMTHVHPDHIFGAGAFEADRPEFVGHARLPAALAQRADFYREGLDKILGKGRAGPVVVPGRLIATQDRIDLGDRTLLLAAHGVAHSDCDLSVFDTASATLLTGDLVFVGRVPALDGSIKGWQKELTTLEAVSATHAVPGHGPVGVSWPGATVDLGRYLDVLLRETRAAFNQGLDMSQAVASVGRSERGQVEPVRRLPRPQRHPGVQGGRMGILTTAAAAGTVTAAMIFLACAQAAPAGDEEETARTARWKDLQHAIFADRQIQDGTAFLSIEAPARALDAALVPVDVMMKGTQSVKGLYLIIDNNPGPLAGHFTFGAQADPHLLKLRVRVNAYTYIHAVAETTDNQLYSVARFVKAAGGCSAPAGGDQLQALQDLGHIKVRFGEPFVAGKPMQAQLMIRHPNFNGMQMDQLTRMVTPAMFIRSIDVSYDGAPVLHLDSDISLSSDPVIGFGFVPPHPGKLKVLVRDTKDATFGQSFDVPAPAG